MGTNPTSMTISLDAMGGDIGPDVVVPAAIRAHDRFDYLNIILVGDEAILNDMLVKLGHSDSERLKVQHASQQVEMDELPSHALRNKKDSSMRVAINLVKEGVADAAISAGNTGALMATGRFVLKMIAGIDRPAICSTMPTATGYTHMLDLGANVDTSADNLLEFAVMGSVLVSAVSGIDNPTIGLLNIGEEEIKGNERVKEAARLLGDSDLNYIGYVEGDDIFAGKSNVVVCDGFVGNVALKSAEGVAKLFSGKLKQAFTKNMIGKLAALVALPVLKRFKREMDPRRYNGASLLGLRGIVVKSHGGADALAFETAIKQAIVEVKNNVPEKISSRLEAILAEGRSK